MSDREYLLIRGLLNRADDFVPRRCGSTRFVRRWPRAEGSDVFVETISHDGDVLRSAAAMVASTLVCAPGHESWRVRGYVPLDPEAERVQLRRGRRVLWEARIPDAPTLRVALASPPVRGNGATTMANAANRRRPAPLDGATPGFPGGRPAGLAIETSEAAAPDLAFLTVVHRWSERGFRTVYIGPVVPRLDIPADRLPGGRGCRLIVTYSNGVRSVTAATKEFRLDPIGGVLSITRPKDGARFPQGSPVALEGLVQDPELPAGPRDPARMLWTVDGRDAGSGAMASVLSLDPGEHLIGFSYRPPDTGAEPRGRGEPGSTASVRIIVTKSRATPADAWPDWDPFTLS
jgi:hypothetical protein